MNILDDLKLQYKNGDMATKLIFWNLLLFTIPEIVFAVLQLFHININYFNYVALSNHFGDLAGQPWTIVSYSFFHSGFFHLLFNMIMLHFASRLLITFFTQKQLFGLYVLGGIFAGIIYLVCYTFLPSLSNQNTLLVGASASIMAILFATMTYQPFMNIRLALFGSIKLWHIAILYLAIDLIQLPLENTGGHLAHLGGAFFGFIWVKFLQNGTDLTSRFNAIIDGFANLFSPKKETPFKKIHRNPKPISTVKTASKIVTKDKTQQQIDEILDKISKSGYDSLTADEKEFLFKVGKSQ
ncbi:transmembrane rhomboid family protein [Flavobacterium psychrophilum]|uniref:Rhomboid family protein n=1 Tax=Flavobacterium psychrophilum (strain ATCC 49511 / DSM 21280 / CIP 103535 / JIP02/86) TaxID=402612 RepID=A6GYR3_FLAPJ|nr:rhomboid family intramembrane serine protease [Flavobacterium psychrophilum]AIG29948.1 transmembrane rhomboid family protein [Flavobacterium psychrophilum]AIG32225.1 transmembrane rhomboid family protein [Flavobacterium psychrophilum]AIG34381.1 transmembrane rhomboid family protein [Flavobacterium psychrophilum]AIG36744.1 transmembrane rhomboid family protein [Flavobacterium psychrophilum]AIG39008.1 transmembrane rhomboid family protein [Flavobacterium psychrophilum]